MALDAVHGEVAHVDAIERKHRHLRGVAARGPALGTLEHLVEAELLGKIAARLPLPVVEVARDDERPLLRARGADVIGEPLELEPPAPRPKSEVHVDAMQPLAPSRHLDLAMKQAAAFQAMVRDVDVLPHADRVRAHDRVAVVAVLVDGVHAVDAVRALVRDELVLRDVGPCDVAARVAFVLALHFLQERDFRAELAQAVADVVQHEPAVELRESLVDVVRDDAEGFRGHVSAFFREASGSPCDCSTRTPCRRPPATAATRPPGARAARRGSRWLRAPRARTRARCCA